MSEERTEKKKGPGRGWHGDPEGHAAAGRKGGLKVSADRAHMARLGKINGDKVSADREHMARIGKRGGSIPRVKERQDSDNEREQGTAAGPV